jgi:hypothetical protein
VAEESSSDEEGDFEVKYTKSQPRPSRPTLPTAQNRQASAGALRMHESSPTPVGAAPIVTLDDLERRDSDSSSRSGSSDDDEFPDGFHVSSSESGSDDDSSDDEDRPGRPRGRERRGDDDDDDDDKVVFDNGRKRGLPKIRLGSKAGARIPLPKPDRSALKAAMWLFSEQDVAVLLFAHQAARSAKRTSRAESHSVSRMELSSDDTEFLSDTLAPATTVEAVTVIAVHVLLLRFVSIYQYRAGALENAVRRFAQGPVGYDLNVRSVGQRSPSRLDSDFGASGTFSVRPASYLPRRMMSSL